MNVGTRPNANTERWPRAHATSHAKPCTDYVHISHYYGKNSFWNQISPFPYMKNISNNFVLVFLFSVFAYKQTTVGPQNCVPQEHQHPEHPKKTLHSRTNPPRTTPNTHHLPIQLPASLLSPHKNIKLLMILIVSLLAYLTLQHNPAPPKKQAKSMTHLLALLLGLER